MKYLIRPTKITKSSTMRYRILDIWYIGFIHSVNQSNKQGQSNQLKTLTNQFKSFYQSIKSADRLAHHRTALRYFFLWSINIFFYMSLYLYMYICVYLYICTSVCLNILYTVPTKRRQFWNWHFLGLSASCIEFLSSNIEYTPASTSLLNNIHKF